MRMKSQKIKVLIADDHDLVRQGLKQILELEEDIEVIGLWLMVRTPSNKQTSTSYYLIRYKYASYERNTGTEEIERYRN